MIIKLNEKDKKSFDRLMQTLRLNDTIVNLYSAYLNFTPRFITSELLEDIANPDDTISTEYACSALLAAAVGIDPEKGGIDKFAFRNYIVPSVKQLDENEYKANPYYKSIKFPTVKYKEWELKYDTYSPYELFVRDNTEVLSDHSEIPQLGYFKREFPFPAILQKGREWMTVTPNEINTMRDAIAHANGSVVTFGLGLGYFAYMTSEKPEVSNVTVIEKDRDVIFIFRKYILPQFSNKYKIKIVCADAFEYAKNILPDEKYNFAFVDLWHDVSDGLAMYAEMRRLESLSPNTEFVYWIEASLLSHLRRLITAELDSTEGKTLTSYEEITNILSDSFLKETAKDIKKLDSKCYFS